VARLSVGSLSAGALHQLLRDQLGSPFARQTLLRIHAASGGNPYFAIELARSLGANVDPLEPLPVPATLEGLLRGPIGRLAQPTRDAIAIVAALGSTSESILARAGISADALEPALAAHVIEREGGTIRFAHPLLASILYQDLGPRRRSLHARVAQVVDDPVVRARHLALSRAAPSADIAARLDDAAQLASDRGASAIAAELAEQAGRLTPRSRHEDRRRRALAAARAHRAAGEWTRARAIALDLLADGQGGPGRAEALILLSELEGGEAAARRLEEALREAGSHPALESLIHCRLAWATRFAGGFDHADAALTLAEALDDDDLRTRARAVQATLSWFAGSAPAPDDLLTVAQQLPAALGGDRLVQEGTQAIVNTFAIAPRIDEARAMFERDHAEWRERDEPRSARALWGLAWLEFWAGRWELAAEHAARAHDTAIQYGLEVPQDHLPISVIAVHRGQLDTAREHSERALAMAEAQFGFHPPQHMAVLALVALWEGETAAALDWFQRAGKRAASLGWGEPSLRWWTADHAELLLEAGRADDASRLVEAWDADAVRVNRPWVGAQVTRSRGLIAAAGGDIDGALTLLARAVDLHEAVGDPFGRARALLALGAARRRDRQKRPAREAIDAAIGAFNELGASTWAARATDEARRVSGRTRQDGLTAAERGIAALVAQGKTNREIASVLFLGERTVASHLTHIYAKLGLRSRTELAHRLRTPAGDPTGAGQDSEVLTFPARRPRP
jgi:DNA-binding CsgD family transcriptional regulator